MPKYPEAEGRRDAASLAPDRSARPPVSAVPPQPAPPTGEPLGAARPRTTPSPRIRQEPHPAPEPPTDPPASPPLHGPRRLLPRREGERRAPAPRTLAAAVCLVMGIGLLGGAAAGAWLSGPSGGPGGPDDFNGARTLWRDVPVDELFPEVLRSEAAGPGGSDRRWTRVAVAPDSGCAHAFDPMLTKALSQVGCGRLVRATYVDETTSGVTTVGLLFTKADEDGMKALRKRFAVENLTERTDLMPRPYAARGTVAADFGDAQRASWTVHVLADAPVVVYSVTGFADGRTVSDPQAAAEATEKGETSAAAQSGLGHDAQGVADRVEQALRQAAGDPDAVPGSTGGGSGTGEDGGDGTRTHRSSAR